MLGLWVSHGPAIVEAQGPVIPTQIILPVAAVTQVGLALRGVDAPMMIDTGASITMLDEEICRTALGPAVSTRDVVGVSGKVETYDVYEATILLAVQVARSAPQKYAIGFTARIVALPTQPHYVAAVGVLGRDFLSHFELTYFGPQGEVALRVPDVHDTSLLIDDNILEADERFSRVRKTGRHRRR